MIVPVANCPGWIKKALEYAKHIAIDVELCCNHTYCGDAKQQFTYCIGDEGQGVYTFEPLMQYAYPAPGYALLALYEERIPLLVVNIYDWPYYWQRGKEN